MVAAAVLDFFFLEKEGVYLERQKMKALITGITGQDGSYLAELLLEKGYEVHGLVRRSSSAGQLERIAPFKDRLVLHEGDISDASSLVKAVGTAYPDEVYNLAAQSHVGSSFTTSVVTGDIVGLGTARLLEACRQVGPKWVRFYQASSSEQFGDCPPPQNELTRFAPRSPYAAAKVYAHHMAVAAREAWGMHVSCGILFNHESPRRGETFVTRKVTLAAARIKEGSRVKLRLGNLDAARDWGHARDYVDAMWRMLQEHVPGDYVVATGEMHTVRELCELAFGHLGLEWREWVEIDPAFLRPAEVNALRGDSSRTRTHLNWCPTTTYADLIREMVAADLHRVRTRVA